MGEILPVYGEVARSAGGGSPPGDRLRLAPFTAFGGPPPRAGEDL
jgi:hypothetical protein